MKNKQAPPLDAKRLGQKIAEELTRLLDGEPTVLDILKRRARILNLFSSYIPDNMPEKVDIRPEITEWRQNKNRDHAEGYNQGVDDTKQKLLEGLE